MQVNTHFINLSPLTTGILYQFLQMLYLQYPSLYLRGVVGVVFIAIEWLVMMSVMEKFKLFVHIHAHMTSILIKPEAFHFGSVV